MAAPKIWLGRVGGRRDQSINQTCNLKTKNNKKSVASSKASAPAPST
jgi:hypothetical protein